MKWNIKGSGLVLWACCLTLFSAAGAAPRNYVVQGDIVYTPACGEAKILPQGYLVVNEGKVQGAYDKLPQDYEGWKKQDCRGKLILPGFCNQSESYQRHHAGPQIPAGWGQGGLGQ